MVSGVEKVDFLFRFVSSDVRNRLQFDEEALYSTTDQVTADKITNDLLMFIPKTSTVTDATACAGGNTYSFSQAFQKVYAFEKHRYRFRLLKHNLTLLGAQNVHVVYGDALELCKNQHQDLVFIDPPWGGPEYKKQDHVDLMLSNTSLSTCCKMISPYTQYIAIKAPTNFNEVAFIQETASFMEMVHKNQQLRKMYLYVFKVQRV